MGKIAGLILLFVALIFGADALYYEKGWGWEIGALALVGLGASSQTPQTRQGPPPMPPAGGADDGGDWRARAAASCAKMTKQLELVKGVVKKRGVWSKTMRGLEASARKLPAALKATAEAPLPAEQAAYKKILLRYFGRNCESLAELFREELKNRI